MTGWILIMTLSWTNPTMVSVIVPTRDDCERIAQEYIKMTKVWNTSYACIEEHK